MEDKILKTIKKYKLIESGDKVLIAVSGGPDSMCLLDILNKLKEKLKIEIAVAHVNHGIRKEAGEETEYIKKYCEKYNIKIYIKYEDVTKLANITYVRQMEQKGLGHAVLQAKKFVGDEPFAVLYGDDVIIGEDPCIGQLIRAYEDTGMCGAVGIKEVSAQDIQKYSSMKVEPLKDNIFKVVDMIEKPGPKQIYSLYSILGRCVLPAEIFDILENISYGAGNELQLTDAMKILAKRSGFAGVDFTGVRYDMGNKLGILKASVEVGINHPEIGGEFRSYLKEIAKSL